MEMNPEIASRWYIDAWCTFDGIVFASESENRDTQPHLRTVFVGPPYWRPIALANAATALRATRGPFQDRLFNAAGDEIAFDSLDQIIEIARRAYLLSGYDTFEPPTTPGMETPVPLVPLDGPPALVAEVENMLHTVVGVRDQQRLAATIRTALMPSTMRAALKRWCIDYAKWTATLLARGTTRQARRDAREWQHAIFTLFGVEAVGGLRATIGGTADARSIQQALLDGLVMRLPARRRDGSIGMIGDALALAFSSRVMLETGRWRELLPVIFAGLVLTRASAPPLESTDLTDDELAAVAEWISEGVPRVVRREHPAAVALEELVERVVRVGRREVMNDVGRRPLPPPAVRAETAPIALERDLVVDMPLQVHVGTLLKVPEEHVEEERQRLREAELERQRELQRHAVASQTMRTMTQS